MSLNQASCAEQETTETKTQPVFHGQSAIIDFEPEKSDELLPFNRIVNSFDLNPDWLTEINETGKIPESLKQYYLECKLPKELSDELNKNLRALASESNRTARFTFSLNPEMVISWDGMPNPNPIVIPRRLTLIENPRDIVVDAFRLRSSKELEAAETEAVPATNRQSSTVGI